MMNAMWTANLILFHLKKVPGFYLHAGINHPKLFVRSSWKEHTNGLIGVTLPMNRDKLSLMDPGLCNLNH